MIREMDWALVTKANDINIYTITTKRVQMELEVILSQWASMVVRKKSDILSFYQKHKTRMWRLLSHQTASANGRPDHATPRLFRTKFYVALFLPQEIWQNMRFVVSITIGLIVSWIDARHLWKLLLFLRPGNAKVWLIGHIRPAWNTQECRLGGCLIEMRKYTQHPLFSLSSFEPLYLSSHPMSGRKKYSAKKQNLQFII